MAYLDLVKRNIEKVVYDYACPVYSDDYIRCQEARENIQMTVNDSLFLETLLLEIRSKTIEYTIKKAKSRKEKEKRILEELQSLELNHSPSNRDLAQIEDKQTELQSLRSTANEGRIIRSRARWYEEGEKGSSSYFLKMEKRNFESKLIPCLNVADKEIRDSSEILNELSKHFGNIFKKQNEMEENEIISYLDRVKMPTLTTNEALSLEQDITVNEIGATLYKFSNNRSPGSDGFPYEFYKVFWADLKWFVLRSLIHGLKRGELSITQREGIITLVPKPAKPKNLISSWRPITLLNSTYKILAGTIANRLKVVLDRIIHPDQTAFLKNRFIGENIRTTYDVLYEAYNRDIEGLLLSITITITFYRFSICLRCNELEIFR